VKKVKLLKIPVLGLTAKIALMRIKLIGIITQTKVVPAESSLLSRFAADAPDISGASGTDGGTARRRPISGCRSLCLGYNSEVNAELDFSS
jgi:hypothetical protein